MQESAIYQEWQAESKQQGKEKERRAIALNLLQEKIPLEIIARTTGLTITQLQQLQTQAKQN
jgi:predicted transposase YdaD